MGARCVPSPTQGPVGFLDRPAGPGRLPARSVTGRVAYGPARLRSGPLTDPAESYFSPPPKAASNDAVGGSKSNRFSRASASGAPVSRSIPASSHSTDTGPS